MTTLPHDRSHLLWEDGEGGGPTPLFTDSIDRWVNAMMADEDGDSEGSEKPVVAAATAKQSGIIAGQCVIDRLLSLHFPDCRADWYVGEGDSVDSGDSILLLSGPASDVLRCERILLNILGRMSGIATCTADWVNSSAKMRVACTRKTEWGLLDKWAVNIGGGLTHRLSRSDALMIKENDLATMMPESSDETAAVVLAVSGIKLEVNSQFIVVEVRTVGQAVAAAEVWSRVQQERGGAERIVLLLDNMGPVGCAKVHQILIKENLRDWCIIEGSGGVTRANLHEWVCVDGIDLVSTSAVNRGVIPLDISMAIRGE